MSNSTNINSLINTGLGVDAPDSYQTPDAKSLYYILVQTINNLIRAIEQYCGITPKDISLWSSLTPSDTILTYNLRRLYIKAAVNLNYGNFVNLFDAGTELKAQKADSGIPLVAHGYVNTPLGIIAGAFGEIILFDGIVTIGGVTRGTSYYLAPNGLIAAAPGIKKQFVGFGVGVNLLCVEIDKSAF